MYNYYSVAAPELMNELACDGNLHMHKSSTMQSNAVASCLNNHALKSGDVATTDTLNDDGVPMSNNKSN